MKKVEVKSIDVTSAFKVTLYVSVIPLGLFFLMGIVLTAIGAVAKQMELLIGGIVYLVIPIFAIGIYGVFSMLVAVIYNGLAGKFGGLVVTVADKEDSGWPYAQPASGPPSGQTSDHPPQLSAHVPTGSPVASPAKPAAESHADSPVESSALRSAEPRTATPSDPDDRP